MIWRIMAVSVLIATPTQAVAQADQLLREALDAFQNLEFEQAARLYNLVLAPGARATKTQRDTAQLYLGVSYEYAEQREDALSAFSEFIRANACAPAPQAFGASVTAVFNQSRRGLVAVGLCELKEQQVTTDDTLLFTVAVTRASLLSIVFRDSGGETVAQMMAELDDGNSTITWANPFDPSDFSERPTELTLLLRARDQAGTATGLDSVPVRMYASSVDTLTHPLPLTGSDLLPELRTMNAAYGDLGKGLAVGVGVAAASMLSYSSLSGEYAKAVAVGGAVSITGIVAFIKGGGNRTIAENQLHNENVRASWEARRDSIVGLNQARLAGRSLVIALAPEQR